MKNLFSRYNMLWLFMAAISSQAIAAGTYRIHQPFYNNFFFTDAGPSQTSHASVAAAAGRKMAVLGSSTAAGQGATVPDSSWVGRFKTYYQRQFAAVDTVYNLAVGGTTSYRGMPSSYVPPAGRPTPDPEKNVTKAVSLLSDLPVPSSGVVIVNFPTNGYDNYSIAEIMNTLQVIYDSATRTGNRCYITTTQPRSDGNFATSSVKRKLAAIKDSIILRFGEAHTINFWDGMFNPADSTILPAYSAGDNVHLNNAGHRVLFNRVLAKNVFSLTYTASAGDYRSNVSATGLWNTAESWQVFDGSAWVTATNAPTSADGVVTIVTGDSIRMNSAVTFDQVIVESNAVLTMFNTGAATTFTLNDGPGTDIENNGRLYISAGGTLAGNGNILNNAGGQFIIRNNGVLQAGFVNEGITSISNTGNIQNATYINNGVFTLVNFTLNLNNATLINNDSLSIADISETWFSGTGGGYLLNNPGAVIFKAGGTAVTNIQSGITFTNSGRFSGTGQFIISNVLSNAGTISVGNAPGILTVNPSFISGKTPTIALSLRTNGGVAGMHYDQLALSAGTTASIAGARLNVTDLTSDPIGTTYTLMRFPSGTFTGTFASAALPPTLGNLVYKSDSITVQKIAAALPLAWERFTVTVSGVHAILEWTTAQELNTSYFIVERSTDGVLFSGIGRITAAGSSAAVSRYSYIDVSPARNTVSYYRLKSIDLDGKESYSAIRLLKFSDTPSGLVQLAPNPVINSMQVTMLAQEADVVITDMHGRSIYNKRLIQGVHHLDAGQWPSGVYWLSVYVNGKFIEAKKVVKF